MLVLDFESARRVLEPAVCYAAVFTQPDEKAMKATYRQLMRFVHPDRVDPVHHKLANELVAKLGAFYRDAQVAASAGSFGRVPVDAILTSAKASHVVISEMSQFCDMTKGLRAKSDIKGMGETDTFIKIARTPRDNDLMARETAALKRLHDSAGRDFVMFYPILLDSFGVMSGRMRLRANVVPFLEGFLNLEELKQYRRDGLHPLDAAWIWRRVLWALGGAHDVGVVHGAVLPRHIMIHPRMHGVVLIDWCYAAIKTDDVYPPLSALVGARRSWYPVDALAKQPLNERMDLAMAARVFCYLLGGDPTSLTMPHHVPDAMQRYVTAIVQGSTKQGAFQLLAQFDTLLQTLGKPYYPRIYRELILQ